MTHAAIEPFTAIPEAARAPAREAQRPSGPAVDAPRPDALECLRCQLLGRPGLACTRPDLCREGPRFHPLGAVLLAAWLAMAAAFVAAVL